MNMKTAINKPRWGAGLGSPSQPSEGADPQGTLILDFQDHETIQFC